MKQAKIQGQSLSKKQAARKLTELVDDALSMLERDYVRTDTNNLSSGTPASLLDQCLKFCSEYEAKQHEPVRTLHHLACTGGSLITKCLCAMPNTQILSEVDPLSPLATNKKKPHFAPTDIITLLKQSNKEVDQSLIVDLFISNLALIYKDAAEKGQRLILRDHSHSHFHTGNKIPERPTLRSIIGQNFDVLSVVTVRHPLDSYLSLQSNNWFHFSPPNFEEYCRRYLAFLDAYKTVPVFKYEDFIHEPEKIMRGLCEILELPYAEDFIDLFGVFHVTGDSGRSDDIVKPRERRPMGAYVMKEIEESRSYYALVERLDYDKLV